MKRHKHIGKAISVHPSSYNELKSGRLKVIYRPDDEWNRAKFCLQPIKWLYVCKTNELTGECLRFDVKSITQTTLSGGSSSIPAIRIQLGAIAETINHQTGERIFHFPPGG